MKISLIILSAFVFSASIATAKDNRLTKGNTSAEKLGDMDPSFAQKDVDLTSKIRSEILANESLSFAGKNVNIVTRNGRVTLKGAVQNTQERIWIEKQATEFAGRTNVVSQLTVRE